MAPIILSITILFTPQSTESGCNFKNVEYFRKKNHYKKHCFFYSKIFRLIFLVHTGSNFGSFQNHFSSYHFLYVILLFYSYISWSVIQTIFSKMFNSFSHHESSKWNFKFHIFTSHLCKDAFICISISYPKVFKEKQSVFFKTDT